MASTGVVPLKKRAKVAAAVHAAAAVGGGGDLDIDDDDDDDEPAWHIDPDHTRCGILHLNATDYTVIVLECKAILLHLNADAKRCNQPPCISVQDASENPASCIKMRRRFIVRRHTVGGHNKSTSFLRRFLIKIRYVRIALE